MKKPTKLTRDELIKNSAKLEMELHNLSIRLCKAEELSSFKSCQIKRLEEALDDAGTTMFYESASRVRKLLKENYTVTQEKPRVDVIDLVDAKIEINQMIEGK